MLENKVQKYSDVYQIPERRNDSRAISGGAYMGIDLIAQMGTWEQFHDQFQEGDERTLHNGLPLIFAAAANTNPKERYRICNFLLDRNSDVSALNKQNQSILHILLGQVEHDIPELASLCKRMIDHGADINALDSRKTVAIKYILHMKYTDEELSPLYDVWFSQPYLDVNTRDKWGLTPIEFAKKIPYRNDAVKRMMMYAHEKKD